MVALGASLKRPDSMSRGWSGGERQQLITATTVMERNPKWHATWFLAPDVDPR